MGIITDVLAIIDKLNDTAKGIKDAKVSSVLVELQGAIMRLQQENFEVTLENQKLKKNIEDYETLNSQGKYIERSKGNVAKYSNGEKEFMICTSCWDSKKQIIQVGYFYSNKYQCPSCKIYSFFGDSEINT